MFTFSDIQEHGDYLVKEVYWKDLVIILAQLKTSQEEDFFAREVYHGERMVWRFGSMVTLREGVEALLIEVLDEPLIVMVDEEAVFRSFFLSEIATVQISWKNNSFGPMYEWTIPHEKSMALKKAAAALLGKRCVLSTGERKLLRSAGQNNADAPTRSPQVQMYQTQEVEASVRARTSLMQRPLLRGYTLDGVKKSGVPVTAEEWRCLSSGTAAILVSSYVNGRPGSMRSFFVVRVRQEGHTQEGMVDISSANPNKRK